MNNNNNNILSMCFIDFKYLKEMIRSSFSYYL